MVRTSGSSGGARGVTFELPVVASALAHRQAQHDVLQLARLERRAREVVEALERIRL